MPDTAAVAAPWPPRFTLSGAMYAERDGKLLVLRRVLGELSGHWYIPGGAVDHGETPADAAVRELHEEAGLRPAGSLTLIGVQPMHVYGADSFQITYACECPDGEVVLDPVEHDDFRWVDPAAYRAEQFPDGWLESVAAADARVGALARVLRDDLDLYLAWRRRR